MLSTEFKTLKEGSPVTGRHFGLDEAGRGPLAGPLVVAAVEFPWPKEFDDAIEAQGLTVNDSKKVSPRKRAAICDLIMTYCRWSVVYIDARFIDDHGMSCAAATAAQRVITQLGAWDAGPFGELALPEQIVFDGTPGNWGGDSMHLFHPEDTTLCFMIDGDEHVPAISAASIVAKQCHDYYMVQDAHKAFPQYGFNQHMGYGTEKHLAALDMYGSCTLHRHTFRPVRERDARA